MSSTTKILKFKQSRFSFVAKKKNSSSSSSTSSRLSTAVIQQIMDKLKNESNRNSTKKNYHCVWRHFNEFFIKLDVKPRNWEDRLTLFVGHPIEDQKKSSTIKSYISAIKYVLREDRITINENKSLLNLLTKACHYINDRVRTRLPIHKDLLHALLLQIGTIDMG